MRTAMNWPTSFVRGLHQLGVAAQEALGVADPGADPLLEVAGHDEGEGFAVLLDDGGRALVALLDGVADLAHAASLLVYGLRE
jgi:hypothetical protein